MKRKTEHKAADKRQRQGIRLLWLILALSLTAGCTWLIPPDQLLSSITTTRTTTTASANMTSGQTTSGQTSVKPSTLPPATVPMTTTRPTTPSLTTTQATTIPGSSATTAATASSGATTATSAATSTSGVTTATTTVDLAAYSAVPAAWYYGVPKPLDAGIRATVPASVARLIAPYPVIWQANPTGTPTVYLTMDEGYEYAGNTAKILDTARDKNVRIAFFITGSYLRAHPELVRRMLDEGHLVLNHTDQHPDLAVKLRDAGASAVLADIRKLESEFEAATGRAMPRMIRPPAGFYSQRLLALLGREGYTVVFWSFAYRDWLTAEQPTLSSARAAILGQLHDGSILLLHAVSSTNTQLLPELIDRIRAQGYRIGLLTDIN